MASAFDGLSISDRESIEKALWRGDSMISIRDGFVGLDGKRLISAARMREMREELFEPLLSDPQKIKALAEGSCINPGELNRPKRLPDRHTRMARHAAKPVQIEMFS